MPQTCGDVRLGSIRLQCRPNYQTTTLWPLPASSTVTEALVLRFLLEDRRRITESIRILVPVNKINVFRSRRNKSVDSSSFSSISSLLHARGAATEKAPTLIRRRVRGTTRLPDNEVHSVDWPGILATDFSMFRDVFRHVSQKWHVNQQALIVRPTGRPSVAISYMYLMN